MLRDTVYEFTGRGGPELLEGGVGMRTYERPTLTKAGSFKKVTGLGGSGPRDVKGRHQSF